MKALVLTYDKQVGLAELVVKSYMALWKDCPLQFVIPRNDDSSPHFDFLAAQKNVSLVRTPPGIHGTMAALLDGFEDEAWVYWCIDDRYPIKIEQAAMQKVLDFIASGAAEHLNAIKLMHWKETVDPSCAEFCIGDRTFRFQTRSSPAGFWHHHFLRVKALKDVFVGSAADGVADTPAALNQYYFQKVALSDGFKSRAFPADGPIIQLGETLANGLLLANACDALAQYNCPVPDYKRRPHAVFFRGSSTSKGDHCIQVEQSTAVPSRQGP